MERCTRPGNNGGNFLACVIGAVFSLPIRRRHNQRMGFGKLISLSSLLCLMHGACSSPAFCAPPLAHRKLARSRQAPGDFFRTLQCDSVLAGDFSPYDCIFSQWAGQAHAPTGAVCTARYQRPPGAGGCCISRERLPQVDW